MACEEKAGARTTMARFASLVRQNARLVVVAVCAIVFLLILDDVTEAESMRLDRAAYWLIVQHLRTPWLTPVMESFSALATPVSMLVVLVVVAAFAPGKRPGWCCAVNLGLVVLINQVLKFIIQRPMSTAMTAPRANASTRAAPVTSRVTARPPQNMDAYGSTTEKFIARLPLVVRRG